MNYPYHFLGYVANNAGIKFGLLTDVKQTIRFDHKVSVAPGSTKQNPIPFIRNSISFSGNTTVNVCTDTCGITVPVTASVNWSGPMNEKALNNALDQVIVALQLRREQLNKGFLPDTQAFTLTVGE